MFTGRGECVAERRMFAKTIIDSDAFLEMPLSTQALYFHMNMRADDDGFLNNPRKIQRMIGCADDDFKLLIAKRFIIPFDSGICVIKHWRIHNYIQKDRYKETVYLEEKQRLAVKNNRAYTLKPNDEKLLDTTCVQNVSSLDAQIRLDKYNTFPQFWGEYPRKVAKKDAQKAFAKINPDEAMLTQMLHALDIQKESREWLKDSGAFIPYPATWLNGRRWEDVEDESEQPKPKRYKTIERDGQIYAVEVSDD